MQDNQTLNTIKAKQKLGLPLTDHERAMFTLYGEKRTSPEETISAINEYARKGAFVEKYLSPMLAAADMQIKSASYRRHINTGEEYVDIIYIGGHKRCVCVTADSLQALILDVMR